MNLKFKIKFYFLTKNYTKLKKLIVENENTITYLEEKEIEELLEYAAKNQEFMLFNTLLLDMARETSEIKQALADKYIKKYLKMFFNNLIFLYSIANMMANDPERYKEEISEIKKFILTEPLTEITIYIHTLNGFYSKEMEDRIFATNSSHFIFCLLESADEKETRRILTKLIEKKPNSEKIYCLANSLSGSDEKLRELKSIILNLETSKSIKGKYLFAYLEGIKERKIDLALIDEIILLNDYATTDKLMQRISKEDALIIINKYLISENKEIIFTLACTTDCKETINLLNFLLPSIDFNQLVTLIMLVKEKYLPFILKQVLKDENECLKLMNQLYLFGSNRWIMLIKYIKENDSKLLSESIKEKLDAFILKEEQSLSRKRILT